MEKRWDQRKERRERESYLWLIVLSLATMESWEFDQRLFLMACMELSHTHTHTQTHNHRFCCLRGKRWRMEREGEEKAQKKWSICLWLARSLFNPPLPFSLSSTNHAIQMEQRNRSASALHLRHEMYPSLPTSSFPVLSSLPPPPLPSSPCLQSPIPPLINPSWRREVMCIPLRLLWEMREGRRKP